MVAEAEDEKRQALSGFGRTLGMAFQLMDDVLDYAADQEKLGKKIGDDFRGGKGHSSLSLWPIKKEQTERFGKRFCKGVFGMMGRLRMLFIF